MAVLTIVVLGAMFAAPLVSSLRGRTLGAHTTRLMGVLEQSREHALAHETYVYLCFAGDPATRQLQVAILASSQGIETFPDAGTFNADLKPISALLRFEDLCLDDVSGQAFGQRDSAGIQFQSVLTPSLKPAFHAPDAQPINFEQVLRFNSRGEAEISIASDANVTRWTSFPLLEIGLRTATGSSPQPAAIQLSGLTGTRRLYRP